MAGKSTPKQSCKETLDLNWVLKYLKDGVYPTGLNFTEKRMIRKRAERFCYLNGDLYYLGTPKDQEIGKKSRKVLLTNEERLKKVQECHVDAEGTHLGLEKTAEGFISDYHWVGMYKFVKDYIRKCPVCIERHPKMLQSPNSSFLSCGDDLEDEGSLAGDDSSVCGSEVGTAVGVAQTGYEIGTVLSPARVFWEKVELRLYGPYRFNNTSKYILVALDSYSLWPEAFVLNTVSPASVADSVLKMICRYGEMCNLIMSSEDEVLEGSLVPALEVMNKELDIQIPFRKCHMQSTETAYQSIEEMVGKFIKKYPKHWAECIDLCIMPLRISRNNEAEYTPSFLAHSREPVLPDRLTHDKGGHSDIQLTAREKLATLDLLMASYSAAQSKVAAKIKLKPELDTKFTPPKASPIPSGDQSSAHAHVTRSRTGNAKPKNDEMFETQTPKRKLVATPSPQQLGRKKVKVESVMTSTPREDRMEEDNSDSDTDVSDDTSKKSVDLDTYYQAIRLYVAGGGYPDKATSSFKRLIRDQAKNYTLQGDSLFHEVGANRTLKKIVMTREERVQLLKETYLKTEGKGQMLSQLEPVHWKGKLIDCEAFLLALHNDRDTKASKDFRPIAEAKRQLQYDTTETYTEIKTFIVYEVFSDDATSKRLDYLKRQLKNFRVENEELFHSVGNKKRKVVTSAATRQQLIANACQKKGASADLTGVFNLVSEMAFWFGMKVDIKVYLSCMDNKHLLERYFTFRELFMNEPMPSRETAVEEEEIATEETVTVNAKPDPPVVVPVVIHKTVAAKTDKPATPGKPSIVTVSSAKEKGSGDTATPSVVVISAPVSSSGDAGHSQTIIPEQPLVVDAASTEIKKVLGKRHIVVRLQDTGQLVFSEADHTGTETTGAAVSVAHSKPSDEVTVAAVKSILHPQEGHLSGDSSYQTEQGETVEVPPTVADDGTETIPGQLSIEIVQEAENVAAEDGAQASMEDSNSQTVDEDEIEDSDDGIYDSDEVEDEDEIYDDEDSKSDVSGLTDSSSLNVVTVGGEKKVVTPRPHFKCSQCDKLFFGPLKFKMHMYKHTGQKPFPCNLCNKKYTNKKSLVIHQRLHSGELPYLCSLCGKRCPSKISLKSHLKCHDGKGGGFPAKCDICQRVFSRRHLMERHRLHKHVNAQSEFKCTECLKVFGHQRSLKRHFMSTHMGVKNHVCGMCGKAFCRKEYLTGHLIQHGAVAAETKKQRTSTFKPRPSVFNSRPGFLNQQFIIKKKEDEEEEGEEKIQGSEEQMQRIYVEQDGSGNIRVLDMAMEKEVQRMLESRLNKGQVGETMVVHIEEAGTGEPQVVHVEQTEEQVVEVPLEDQGSYVEYQQIDPDKPHQYVITSSTGSGGATQYIYAATSQSTVAGSGAEAGTSSSSGTEFGSQGELLYGQPAVQYEVECVGEVGDEEALSAINLLAQASAQQYETVISQI